MSLYWALVLAPCNSHHSLDNCGNLAPSIVHFVPNLAHQVPLNLLHLRLTAIAMITGPSIEQRLLLLLSLLGLGHQLSIVCQCVGLGGARGFCSVAVAWGGSKGDGIPWKADVVALLLSLLIFTLASGGMAGHL